MYNYISRSSVGGKMSRLFSGQFTMPQEIFWGPSAYLLATAKWHGKVRNQYFFFIWRLDVKMTEFIEQIPFKKKARFPLAGKQAILPPKELLRNLLLKLGLLHWVSPPKKMFWGPSLYYVSIPKWDGKVWYLNFFLYVKTERDDIIIHVTYSLRKSKVSH